METECPWCGELTDEDGWCPGCEVYADEAEAPDPRITTVDTHGLL